MLTNFQQVVEVAKVSHTVVATHLAVVSGLVLICVVADGQVLEVREGAEGLTTKAVNEQLLKN
jgi:3-hydroxyisobutyrate dehydrogenase-like beta-hydroxyacid dehydrogenase